MPERLGNFLKIAWQWKGLHLDPCLSHSKAPTFLIISGSLPHKAVGESNEAMFVAVFLLKVLLR